MGEKKAKDYRRAIRRNKSKIIESFVLTVKGYKFLDRLKFAWAIIKAG